MDQEPRILRSGDARRMRWKNGGGETIEIAANPPGAGFDAFAWRVSLARIDRDGPFSAFPEVDRIFAVLDGTGVELQIDSMRPNRLTPESAPWAFPGEAPCRCRLLDGPVSALNVMTARGKATCVATRLDAQRGLPRTDDAVTIVVCTRGVIATGLGSLERHDAIVVPAGASVDFEPHGWRGLGFVVVLRRRPEGSEP